MHDIVHSFHRPKCFKSFGASCFVLHVLPLQVELPRNTMMVPTNKLMPNVVAPVYEIERQLMRTEKEDPERMYSSGRYFDAGFVAGASSDLYGPARTHKQDPEFHAALRLQRQAARYDSTT